MISDEDYIATQAQLAALVRVVREMPLEAFLERISRAHAVGPIVHPTLYRDAMENLQGLEHHARAALDFKRAILS